MLSYISLICAVWEPGQSAGLIPLLCFLLSCTCLVLSFRVQGCGCVSTCRSMFIQSSDSNSRLVSLCITTSVHDSRSPVLFSLRIFTVLPMKLGASRVWSPKASENVYGLLRLMALANISTTCSFVATRRRSMSPTTICL